MKKSEITTMKEMHCCFALDEVRHLLNAVVATDKNTCKGCLSVAWAQRTNADDNSKKLELVMDSSRPTQPTFVASVMLTEHPLLSD